MNAPVFAVVGHPNKGKSSLVATLARDPGVRIAAEPGTTTEATPYPMRVDGETLYTLVDTPGFQRPRRVLEWLREHAGSASERPAAVRRFVETHAATATLRDECELLRPVVEGAGIIYVVDGAVPYAPEYEPEMEVLRWTGQPSMAVINPIGEPRHVEDWQRALGQYFRVVRVMDAQRAGFERRLQLLTAFGELHEDWRAPLERAIAALRLERDGCVRRSAAVIARLLAAALTLRVDTRLDEHADAARVAAGLQDDYRERLRALEEEARDAVQAAHRLGGVERLEDALPLLADDLFAAGSWRLFGLGRNELAGAAAVAGAGAGAGIDVLVGGTSLMMGAITGAVASGALAWLGADRLAEVAHEKGAFGERVLACGPPRNVNLGFVLLGRARVHHAAVAGRSHAERGHLAPGMAAPPALDADTRKALLASFERLRRAPAGETAELEHALAATLATLLAGDLRD